MKKAIVIIGVLLVAAGCARLKIPSAPELSGSRCGVGVTQIARYQEGVNFACWYKGCFQYDEVKASLDAARAVGIDWLTVVPTWYQETASSSEIFEDGQKSATADDLRSLISKAHEMGFKILLKPHIDTKSGEWRGTLNPANLSAWHDSYKDFILNFAELSEELDVEIIAIGTELKTRSGDTDFWRGLIPQIKTVYSGELTYAANWDEYDNVDFWDLLDYIGIDFYFPISDSSNPTQAEMEETLKGEEIGEMLESFSDEKGKQFIFTEIGYRSVDGATNRPWDYGFSATEDEQEQADAYRAVLTAYADAGWLAGIHWWRWDTQLESDDEGYTPYGKLAADVLSEFWLVNNSNTSECEEDDASVVSSAEGAVSFVSFGDFGRRGNDDQTSVAQAIGRYCSNEPCDFIMTLGDNFYDDGVASTADSHWEESYHNVYDFLNLPFYAMFGNHDLSGNPQAQIDYTNADPTGNWRMPAHDYSFCQPSESNCLVETFVINSDYSHFGEGVEDNAEVKTWFESAVNSSTATWKILAMHHPIISNGQHGDWNQGDTALEFMIDTICGKVDLVIAGHDHSFAHLKANVDGRTVSDCPIDQLVMGNGGTSLREVDESDPRVISTGSFHGFGWFNITPNQLLYRMIDTSDNTFHTFTLNK